MEFDWDIDDEYESDMEDALDDDAEKELDEVLDEEIKAFPKTAAGMVELFEYLKHYNYEDGWYYLWEESEFMDMHFRMLVALHIATRFTELNATFPDLRPWVRSLKAEAAHQKNDAAVLTLLDIIHRDLRNGTLAVDLNADEGEILQFAISLDKEFYGQHRENSNLIAVCWVKAERVGRAYVHMRPRIDFVPKDIFLRSFKVIPEYEKIALHQLPLMDYYDLLALGIQRTSVTPIHLGPRASLTNLLNAEVPVIVDENRYSVAHLFLKGYLERVTKEKKTPVQYGGELTEKEMVKLVRGHIFNKISFYKALSAIKN